MLLGVCLAGFVGLPLGAWWLKGRALEAERVNEEFWSHAKFRQIERMLLLYHEEHGAFPPTKYQVEPGGPVHSWRILLLPHAGASFKERFAAYDFSQAYNSSNNLQALENMPDFDYFSIKDGRSYWADYLTIGEGDKWPSNGALRHRHGKKPLRAYLVEKGDDRFLLVELPGLMIHWREPKY